MPASSVGICAAVAFANIAESDRRAFSTGRPRSMSLAPSSTISAPVSGGTLQSKRARPSPNVSPETPALTTFTS